MRHRCSWQPRELRDVAEGPIPLAVLVEHPREDEN